MTHFDMNILLVSVFVCLASGVPLSKDQNLFNVTSRVDQNQFNVASGVSLSKDQNQFNVGSRVDQNQFNVASGVSLSKDQNQFNVSSGVSLSKDLNQFNVTSRVDQNQFNVASGVPLSKDQNQFNVVSRVDQNQFNVASGVPLSKDQNQSKTASSDFVNYLQMLRGTQRLETKFLKNQDPDVSSYAKIEWDPEILETFPQTISIPQSRSIWESIASLFFTPAQVTEYTISNPHIFGPVRKNTPVSTDVEFIFPTVEIVSAGPWLDVTDGPWTTERPPVVTDGPWMVVTEPTPVVVKPPTCNELWKNKDWYVKNVKLEYEEWCPGRSLSPLCNCCLGDCCRSCYPRKN